MKFFTLVIILIFILFGPISWWATADINQSKEDVRFQFENYTKAYSEFQIARARFKRFRTLPTEIEALAAFKKVLKARSATIVAYFALLQEKLNQTEGIEAKIRNDLISQINSNKGFLADFENRVENSKNLTEAENLSSEFENQKDEWEVFSIKVRGITFNSGLLNLVQKTAQLTQKVEEVLAKDQNLPDLGLRQGRIVEAYSKLAETQNATLKAVNFFLTLKPGTTEKGVFESENEGKKNANLAKDLLTQAIFAVTQAARGF